MSRFWDDKRYYSLDYYLKNTFGEKVYRLSLNGGMTCPNRDGTLSTGGCTFCCMGSSSIVEDSGSFSGNGFPFITKQIEQSKERISAKTSCRKYIAYFQAYTNTYAPAAYLRRIFTEALRHPDIAALSIATRCDCLPLEILDLLEELNHEKPVWVELGLQTIHASTLLAINSSFTLSQYENAVAALSGRGIDVITHLILGLPDETPSMMRASAAFVAQLPVKGIKLQLLHILKGTMLAKLYEKKPFPLFSLEDYCDFIAEIIGLLPPEMVIHRITGDGPKNLLIAPLWSTDKKRVLNTIQKRLRETDSWQGKNWHP